MFCIWVGSLIFKGLGSFIPIMAKMPNMLWGVIGAFLIWPIMQKLKLDAYADKATMSNIGGVFLEITVCAAIATLNLKFFAANIVPILILTLIDVIWISFYTQVLFPKWLKHTGCGWETSMYYFGSQTGVVATGYALLRCLDPKMKTEAWAIIGMSSWTTVISQTLIALLPLLLCTGTSKWVLVGVFAAEAIFWFVVATVMAKKSEEAKA